MVAKRQVECMAGRITFLRGQPENWGTQQPITHPLFIFSLFSNVFHLHICKSVMCQNSDWGMCNRLCSIYLWTIKKIFQKGDHRLDNCECGYNCLTFLDSAFSNGIFLTRTGSKIFPTSSLQDGDFSPQCIFKGYLSFITFFIFVPDKDDIAKQLLILVFLLFHFQGWIFCTFSHVFCEVWKFWMYFHIKNIAF